MIKVVIKECDSKRDDFPSAESNDGREMVQVLRKEINVDNDDNDDKA